MRKAKVNRNTNETNINIEVNLDGNGKCLAKSGIDFFDHLLSQLCFYSGIDVVGSVNGDLEIDCHHTLEDLGYVVGSCINEALGEKRGINRFACQYIPMDEALVRTVIDISGRSFLKFDYIFLKERIGALETECIKEFLRAFVSTSKMTIHIDILRGENNHHIAEAVFKSLGRSLGLAMIVEGNIISSTKGVI